MHKPYILAIGDIVTDAFIKLKDDEAKVETDEQGNKHLVLPFGTKPPYDHVDIVQAVGPSPNASVAFSRLGAHSGLMAYMGDDIPGKDMLAYLGEQNVDTSTISVAEGMKSNYWYVLRYGAERTILVKNEQYDYKWQEPAQVPDWIYLSALDGASWELHMELLGYLRKHPDTKLVFQPGTFHFKWGAEKLAEIYARSYMVCMNKEEAADVTGRDLSNIEDLFDGLHNLGSEVVVITDGPQGSYASDGKKIISIPNYPDPKPPTDRTGAGDAFASTITTALALGESLETALTWAPINSMNVCQHLGAQAGLLDKEAILTLLGNAPDDYKSTVIAGTHDAPLEDIARSLVENPKGIFAADESGGSINKRFIQYGIEDSEEVRRQYRQLFFTAPEVEHYLSGVILFDETARQAADNKQPFPELLSERGIIPGVKVDKGIVALPGFDSEGVTSGLDGLPERLAEYHALGLRFAKWRAAFTVTDALPSDAAIAANVHALARYALDCQNAGIVPIVEPEIVHEGDFSIDRAQEVTARILDALFEELALLGVNRKAIILKTSMVLAGSKQEQSSTEAVAKATVSTLVHHVPHDIAGIVFLSGGQTPEQATANLQAITNLGEQAWPITFSFSRALQEPVLEVWGGQPENAEHAQATFTGLAKANSDATVQQDTIKTIF
ncbi:fructose-bisphosphate aldolase class I [Candidatus Saccharibacteria bacterium]|nr:fructose-bisphosphate aldolase class I [Candidatus Saccharibacteria bacterium]